MYDDLIQRLRDTYEADYIDHGILLEAADAIEELWKLFQSAEKDNAKLTSWYAEKCNKHKWIPVTERLPKEGRDGFSDDVLMLIEEQDGDITWRDIYVGYYFYDAVSDKTGWWVMMTCDCTKVGEHKHGGKIYKNDEKVTHWMPLPEPPKEGEA